MSQRDSRFILVILFVILCEVVPGLLFGGSLYRYVHGRGAGWLEPLAGAMMLAAGIYLAWSKVRPGARRS